MWSWDPETRIYLGDFSIQDHLSVFTLDPIDEEFMLNMMERDDVTVISQGLLDKDALDPLLWNRDNIGASMNQDFFHRFRRFDTLKLGDGTEETKEIDVLYAMQMRDYCCYLGQRERLLGPEPEEGTQREFVFKDHEGKEFKIDVVNSALYMIDLDLNKLLPKLGENFGSAFRYPSVLPGGRRCMMNDVTSSARPFMGPNCKFFL